VARANGRRESQKAQKVPTRGKERPEGPEGKPEGLEEGPGQQARPEVSPRGGLWAPRARG
jgi:hypothetical protein